MSIYGDYGQVWFPRLRVPEFHGDEVSECQISYIISTGPTRYQPVPWIPGEVAKHIQKSRAIERWNSCRRRTAVFNPPRWYCSRLNVVLGSMISKAEISLYIINSNWEREKFLPLGDTLGRGARRIHQNLLQCIFPATLLIFKAKGVNDVYIVGVNDDYVCLFFIKYNSRGVWIKTHRAWKNSEQLGQRKNACVLTLQRYTF